MRIRPENVKERQMAKEVYHREYPLFSLCGLNCSLCPNHYTVGRSRCAGCGGVAFFNPSCAIVACAKRHGGVEYCFLCEEYPCERYTGADASDSFITHRNQLTDFEKAMAIGLEAYQVELNEKVKILQQLLGGFNDGRRKNFFCIAVNLLELRDIKRVMAQLEQETQADGQTKEKAAAAARLLQAMADKRGVSLKLRKKEAK